MTNDLNTIPASVRDALDTCRSGVSYNSMGEGYDDTYFDEELIEQAKTSISKLCQPNIAIVDLDNENLVKLFAGIMHEGMEIVLDPHDIAENLLAALKENSHAK